MLKNTRIALTLLLVLFLISPSLAWSKTKEEIPFKIGVNRFAWYAALQTINFMPISFVDPFAGAILTEWYSLNGTDRYKVDIYVLEENLTANTVQVKVFKQQKHGGTWEDVKVSPDMARKMEDSILNTARELRIEYTMSKK